MSASRKTGRAPPSLSEAQILRYAGHILLPEIGGAGQARLLSSKVLVIGAGGLGAPLLMYLAAAGVGTLGIVDDDRVESGNLQRQIAYGDFEVGALKTDAAAKTVARLNPDTSVVKHKVRFSASNAASLVAAYDVVADGSDNMETRYAVNDACCRGSRPLVTAAVTRFEAQLMTVKPWAAAGLPCYQCLFPEEGAGGDVAGCADDGILGAVAGVAGAMQTVEVVKELLGVGDSLAGRILLYDALGGHWRGIRVEADPACLCCGSLRS